MFKSYVLKSKSFIDFIYMFISNIIKKGFGFLREIILASFFGSSIIYANFLLLRTVADLFSQLTLGNALQANLLPKFAKLYSKYSNISLVKVFDFSKGVLWKLFLISQLIQLPIIWYLNSDHYYSLIVISFILGIVECTNFYNTIFLTIMQAQGKFKQHSLATTLNLFVSTVILYPLAYFFNIIGVALSRLIAVLVLSYTYVRPMELENKGNEVQLEVKDFNFSIMILGNFASIIILLARFVSGADGGNTITYFTYSVILLNALFTAVMVNLNTLILRKLAIQRNLKIILLGVTVSLILALGLIYVVEIFSVEFISFAFQRGAFTHQDVIESASYMRDMSKAFIFIFIASVLFQPFFSMDVDVVRKESRPLALIFVSTILIVIISFYFNNWDVRFQSIIMFYSMAFISMILSFFAVYKYFNIERSFKSLEKSNF